MKIPGKLTDLQNSDNISTERTNRGRSELVRRLKESLGAPNEKNDEVKVSNLGQLLKEELDPAKLAADRKKKIEDLKLLIKGGKYNPPVEKVAEALSSEISLEILSHGGFGDEEE